MRKVEAFVPFLPTKWLNPNRGERREGRVPALIVESKREMRASTALWLLSLDQVRAVKEPFDYARVSVTMYWKQRKADGLYRAEDATNAVYALKPFYDGLIDAGLIKDDGYKHMKLGDHEIIVSKGHDEGCYVTVEEWPRPAPLPVVESK